MKLFSKSTGGFYDVEVHGDRVPDDVVELTDDEHMALLIGQSAGKRIVADDDGRPVLRDPPPPTREQQIAQIEAALQAEMERRAKLRGYDSLLSACSYAAQPLGSPFQAEGAAFVIMRSTVWADAYVRLAQVEAGESSLPTPADAVAAMPPLVLP